ncbi:N-acetyltransferase [Micromonospora tulbaghiae]|uniref:N-acetyltransferase n=1 Tax=Micromonospora tulbaghiae TaxID=479978 RepID=UPI0033F832A7
MPAIVWSDEEAASSRRNSGSTGEISVDAVTVQPATVVQADALVTVIASSLLRSAVARWLVPDTGARASLLRSYSRLLFEAGMRSGQVHTAARGAAVSIWYERRKFHATGGVSADELRRLLGRFADRFVSLHTCIEATIPQAPHAYLSVLGALPERNDAALALLRHRQQLLDAVGQPAYTAVCTAEPRETVFTPLGYVPRSPTLLAPGGPVLWRMWRPASSARADVLPRRARLHHVSHAGEVVDRSLSNT